ncbi:DUF2190 family protein [Bartonella sp. HY761]|uniref:DUF2190 family protein n=1 Tax=Bartonella sp. HY761 TaxID=2979330 RepID=UPI00220FB653|nr:DUF2190 family protein [Bartonella sp. HY761]UXN07520.1 DUF2190 family protein [Bartonella sp. HY761]
MTTPYFRGSIETMTITIIASAPIQAGQLVGFDNKPATAGKKVFGVAANDGEATGDSVRIVTIGLVDMEAGAAIEVGDELSSNAEGLPIPTAAGASVFGIATRKAGIGERVSILIR